MKNLRNVGVIVSIIGAAVTFGIMYAASSALGSGSDLLVSLGFYAWAILPFVVLIVLTSYIHRKGLSPASRVAILLTTVLVVASSVLVYWASVFDSESSTSALVFIFVPLYALAAIAVVYWLSWLLLRSFMPTARA